MFETWVQCASRGGGVALWMFAVLLPMAWPLWQAWRALRSGREGPCAWHLGAALVVGGLCAWMLWPFLFGDGLKQGSTAGFIFLIAPLYGALALLAAYGLAALLKAARLHSNFTVGRTLWTLERARHFFWLPLALLCTTFVGLVMTLARLCAA